MKPEESARKKIDALLELAGWKIQDFNELNLAAGVGVTVREFPLPGAGFADYMLFVERHAIGVVEAKPEEIRQLGKAGWAKYDEITFNGQQMHFYRKPKRFNA